MEIPLILWVTERQQRGEWNPIEFTVCVICVLIAIILMASAQTVATSFVYARTWTLQSMTHTSCTFRHHSITAATWCELSRDWGNFSINWLAIQFNRRSNVSLSIPTVMLAADHALHWWKVQYEIYCLLMLLFSLSLSFYRSWFIVSCYYKMYIWYWAANDFLLLCDFTAVL